jgi:serine acetyltransferase
MRGVTLNRGCIVAAGAIVTKDVPPYAILAGCPAKIIKYRFSLEQSNKLMKINWCDWDEDKIKSRIHRFYNINEFVGK